MILVSPPSWYYAQFQEAGDGQFDCSALGGQRISGESECRIAAMKLDKTFDRTLTYKWGGIKNTDADGRQKHGRKWKNGCWARKEKWGWAYWNHYYVGMIEDNASLICKVGGKINIQLILKYFITL